MLWNGPASYFEKQNFAFGTIEVLNMCVETTAMTIIGGGHTSALVEARGRWESHAQQHRRRCNSDDAFDGKMPVIRSLIESYGTSQSTLSGKGLSYLDGATGEIRTPDLLITNQTLYQAKLQWQRVFAEPWWNIEATGCNP